MTGINYFIAGLWSDQSSVNLMVVDWFGVLVRTNEGETIGSKLLWIVWCMRAGFDEMINERHVSQN